MNVKDIVTDWIVGFGYDGLFNDRKDCSCTRENLFPCGEPSITKCEAGYMVNAGERCDICGAWHEGRMVAEKGRDGKGGG